MAARPKAEIYGFVKLVVFVAVAFVNIDQTQKQGSLGRT